MLRDEYFNHGDLNPADLLVSMKPFIDNLYKQHAPIYNIIIYREDGHFWCAAIYYDDKEGDR